MGKQKILVITTSYPVASESDGKSAAGVFVKDFCDELSTLADVRVLAPGDRNKYGVPVSTYWSAGRALSTLSVRSPKDAAVILAVLWSGLWMAILVMHKEKRFFHVLALWSLPSGFWALFIKWLYGVKYSTWSLGSDIWSLGKMGGAKQILRLVLKKAENNFADGLQLCRDVQAIADRECFFLPSTRTLNCVLSKPSAEGLRYTFLGRWHVNKGADLLCEALCSLSDDDWKGIEHFWFCGDGPMNRALLPQLKHLQASGRPVKITGYVNQVEVEKILNDSDFLVIPSRIESIPVVFSDAVAYNNVVISTPVGDLPSLIESYGCGLLCEDVSEYSLIEAIRRSKVKGVDAFMVGVAKAKEDFSQKKIVRSFLQAIS